MEKLVLYTNKAAVQSDLDNLNETQESLTEIREFLITKSVEPNKENIKNAIHGIFDIPVKQFKVIESDKIRKIIESFGESALTDGWEIKVDQKAKSFKEELINGCPKMERNNKFLAYFIYDNGISVNPQFTKQFFVDKNSVILSTPKEIEFYEKHCKAVDLLNELTSKPDNEFSALDKLFFFNSETKEFELNLKQYHDLIQQKIDTEEEKRGNDYNKAMRERYEENQIKLKENRGAMPTE